MTTEELIKALREKPSRDNRKFLDEVADCVEMLQNAIFALNEEWTAQNAEIERYEKTVGKLAINKDGIAIGTLNGKQTEYIQKSVAEVFRNMAVNRAKAEAVKEFAERLKQEMEDFARMDFRGSTYFCVGLHHIDNLVKEFTEGQE